MVPEGKKGYARNLFNLPRHPPMTLNAASFSFQRSAFIEQRLALAP